MFRLIVDWLLQWISDVARPSERLYFCHSSSSQFVISANSFVYGFMSDTAEIKGKSHQFDNEIARLLTIVSFFCRRLIVRVGVLSLVYEIKQKLLSSSEWEKFSSNHNKNESNENKSINYNINIVHLANS